MKMKDQLMRLQKVKQILRTMESEFEMVSDSGIWVDCGLWHISLPDDEPKAVHLGFIPKVGANLVADPVVRFTATATLMGLDVIATGTVVPDSTSAVAAWIKSSNEE
jgi:hypothetical protein